MAIFTPFLIRLTRPDDIPRVRAIENEAGPMFSGLGLIDDALDGSFPIGDLVRLVGMGQVWVGCTEDGAEKDRPVGMVIASMREGDAYVEELDVMPKRAVLSKARLQGSATRGVDARHAGYP